MASPAEALGELVAGMRSAFAELAAELETLSDDDMDAKTENVKYGPEPLSAFFDRYVIGHKAGHLDQLRSLAASAVMLPGCVPFPDDVAERYRQAGYWRGERLGDLLRRWAEAGGDRHRP